MPDVPIMPPNKRVNQLVEEVTNELWKDLNIKDTSTVRNDKITTFLIRQIAELRAFIEMINGKG